jgi:hypothetical protein
MGILLKISKKDEFLWCAKLKNEYCINMGAITIDRYKEL